MQKEQDNKLPFLDVLVTYTEQGFRSSVYYKYLNFNSHHPYMVNKGIVCCLQHRAKTISGDTDAYQKEMISLRHNLHHNNYPECITLAPRNLDRRIEDNTQKFTTVCLPYVKGLAKRIQKICTPYDIRTVFTSGSTLQSSHQRNSTWSRTVFTPSLGAVVKYTKKRQVTPVDSIKDMVRSSV